MPIAIKDNAQKLTAIIEPSDGVFVASCPELDLATEGDSPDEALDELLDMVLEYAEDYMAQFELFSQSPNRQGHEVYIRDVYQKRKCK